MTNAPTRTGLSRLLHDWYFVSQAILLAIASVLDTVSTIRCVRIGGPNAEMNPFMRYFFAHGIGTEGMVTAKVLTYTMFLAISAVVSFAEKEPRRPLLRRLCFVPGILILGVGLNNFRLLAAIVPPRPPGSVISGHAKP